MRALNRERGQTFVIVTHDPQIGALCDRIVRMEDGEIISDGIATMEAAQAALGDELSLAELVAEQEPAEEAPPAPVAEGGRP
jgi:ABC-type lipoprotein export system ATPase subunit